MLVVIGIVLISLFVLHNVLTMREAAHYYRSGADRLDDYC